MKVLVLGASGFIGQRIVWLLGQSNWATPVIAGRRAAQVSASSGIERRQVDTLDLDSLKTALTDIDAVVNCVAGNGPVIATGAKLLVEAALATSRPRIIHMSSMAAYGRQEGELSEDAPLDPELGWYAKAKCEAEASMCAYAKAGNQVIMLRPGCVHGPGSEMWVERIARLLVAGRLGNIGAEGDGWSNLIHVDDVAEAVLLSLRHEPVPQEASIFNLSAPDSPRWNQYFSDLAMALDAVPVKSVNPKFIKLDAKIGAPIIKISEILLRKLRLPTKFLPVAVPPSLLKLWRQQIKLKHDRARDQLHFAPRSYEQGLAESAAWARENGIVRARH
ncbi:NAD(P)-dependent oxidoreductase [Herbaspirillum sp. RU 5E]|nr:NAD(P)-dependent oxidoreductase [Herbaspirillum sp. RU 5E]